MNWFERYGVVGTYFLLLSLLWTKCFNPVEMKVGENYFLPLSLAILPLGYTITIISQWLNYRGGGGNRIHRQILKDSKRTTLKLHDNIKDEDMVEVALTAHIRLNTSLDINRIQYFASFATKRFDVLAINRSLILATWLSPFATLSIIWPFFQIDHSHCYYSRILILLSAIITCGLMFSNIVMSRQIREMNWQIAERDSKNGTSLKS